MSAAVMLGELLVEFLQLFHDCVLKAQFWATKCGALSRTDALAGLWGHQAAILPLGCRRKLRDLPNLKIKMPEGGLSNSSDTFDGDNNVEWNAGVSLDKPYIVAMLVDFLP